MSTPSLRRGAAYLQANVDPKLPVEQWPLDVLARKMGQYCYLMEDLSAEKLLQESGGDYEELRYYLHERSVQAYKQKVCRVRRLLQGLRSIKNINQYYYTNNNLNIYI